MRHGQWVKESMSMKGTILLTKWLTYRQYDRRNACHSSFDVDSRSVRSELVRLWFTSTDRHAVESLA